VPYFGYPLIKISDYIEEKDSPISTLFIGNSKNYKKYTNEDDLPFKQALNSKRREDRIYSHVFKCFTFGKPIKRTHEIEIEHKSKVEALKKRFKRMELLR
jgi:hypothetical protein